MPEAEEIVELIRNEVLTEEKGIGAETRLFSTGLLDSIQLTSLFMSLEQKYRVSIGPFDVSQENFDTPAQIAEWLNQST